MDRSWAFRRRVPVDCARQSVPLLQRLRWLKEKYKENNERSSNASGLVFASARLA